MTLQIPLFVIFYFLMTGVSLAEKHYETAAQFEQEAANPILTDRTSFKAVYFDIAAVGIEHFFTEIERTRPATRDILVANGVQQLGLLPFANSLGGQQYNKTERLGIIYASTKPDKEQVQVDTIAHELCHIIVKNSPGIDEHWKDERQYLDCVRRHQKPDRKWVNPVLETEEAWCEDFIGLWLDDYGYRAGCTEIVRELRQSQQSSDGTYLLNLE